MTFDAFHVGAFCKEAPHWPLRELFRRGRPSPRTPMVGFVYVGSRDDYGYNQAHAAGAAALKKMAGIKVVEEEKVPETDAVEKTMESMINLDGATLLFPTSFGYYNPHMIKIAKKYPKLRFEHCGGLWSDKDPEERRQLFRLHRRGATRQPASSPAISTKTGKLGFVAAKPIPQVLRNINAFSLGAKLANPKATLQVIFTGDWSMPVKEAEATNSLIDQGVRRAHLPRRRTEDRGGERRAARRHGVRLSRQPATLAPKAYLTGAEWNWEVLYPRFVKMFAAGETIPNFYRGGLKEAARQGLALRRHGVGRGAQAGRRRQGQAHRRQLRDLQGPDRRQQGQDRHRRRRLARPDRSPSSRRWTIWSRA